MNHNSNREFYHGISMGFLWIRFYRCFKKNHWQTYRPNLRVVKSWMILLSNKSNVDDNVMHCIFLGLNEIKEYTGWVSQAHWEDYLRVKQFLISLLSKKHNKTFYLQICFKIIVKYTYIVKQKWGLYFRQIVVKWWLVAC